MKPEQLLEQARKMEAWGRLVTVLHQQEPEVTPAAAEQEAEQRARQLVGMLCPASTTRKEKQALSAALLAAAREEAAQAPTPEPIAPTPKPRRQVVRAEPVTEADELHLSQTQRAQINLIARSIHRRYLISDRRENGQPLVSRGVQLVVQAAERSVGTNKVALETTGGKPSELHALIEESVQADFRLSRDCTRHLLAGDLKTAEILARQAHQHRAVGVQAQKLLDKARVKHHTGRFFHGDILSVRQEHYEDGVGYQGMTQWYVRLSIVYAADGYTVTVANAEELESLSGLRVGPRAWKNLCRWIEDHTERMNGRKQGRRQDDDRHLVYRDHNEVLELRKSVAIKWPELPRALECLRLAMQLDLKEQDIEACWEIPGEAPSPGFHAAEQSEAKQGA